MPTSKDILTEAQKSLANEAMSKMALKDAFTMGTKDVAVFSKARAELATSSNSMKGLIGSLEDSVKKLNKAFGELKKNETVMKAPADAKAYKALVADYVEAIRNSMEWSKELSDLQKKAEKLL